MLQHRQFKTSERAIAAIHDDIRRVTGGRNMHWIMVHDIAERLGLDNNMVDAAVRAAIDRGWLVGDADPPDSVRLSASSIQRPI